MEYKIPETKIDVLKSRFLKESWHHYWFQLIPMTFIMALLFYLFAEGITIPFVLIMFFFFSIIQIPKWTKKEALNCQQNYKIIYDNGWITQQRGRLIKQIELSNSSVWKSKNGGLIISKKSNAFWNKSFDLRMVTINIFPEIDGFDELEKIIIKKATIANK